MDEAFRRLAVDHGGWEARLGMGQATRGMGKVARGAARGMVEAPPKLGEWGGGGGSAGGVYVCGSDRLGITGREQVRDRDRLSGLVFFSSRL
jgi:hypothetical protein